MFTFVLGTRPELIKLYPVIRECADQNVQIQIVHSGQHYDYMLSQVFIEELRFPFIDYYLGVGSGSHAEQVAQLLLKLETVLVRNHPQGVLAVGDTNTVLASALASSKLGIPFLHVEAGVRSGDMTMPEEINRRAADSLASVCFAPTKRALNRLRLEGHDKRAVLVGDTLVEVSRPAGKIAVQRSKILEQLGLKPFRYAVMTLHRSENVDSHERILGIVMALEQLPFPVIYPIHPRARKMLEQFELLPRLDRAVRICEPLGYSDFLALLSQSRMVLTDSGGVQQEASILNVPCMTMRYNTEWIETVEAGKNKLVGAEKELIVSAASTIWSDDIAYDEMRAAPSPFFEGASQKIVHYLKENPENVISIQTSNFLENGIPG